MACDFAHAINLIQRHESGVGHHLSIVVLGIEVEQICREGAILRRRLHNHFIGFTKTNEARLIIRAHQHREIVERLARLHTFLQCQSVVDMEHILRIAGRIERKGIAYFGPFVERCHKVFAHALHLMIIVVASLV